MEQSPPPPAVHEYGRYVYKPVVERTLAEVIGVCKEDIVQLVREGKVILNGETLSVADLSRRLESGDYEVHFPAKRHIWRFFIL